MSSNIEDQVLALAGVMQASTLVDELARKGEISDSELSTVINGILNTSPSSTMDVFGDIFNLRLGLNSLRTLLNKEGKGVSPEVVRYGMSLLHVEAKMRSQKSLLDAVASGVEKTQGQLEYFQSPTHETIISSLASCYLDSISKLSFRIQVTGNPALLKEDRVAQRIRCALLFGLRCAILWRQLGGRRWHFVFKRNKLVAATRALQAQGLN